NPKKLCTIFHYYATNDDTNNAQAPRLLQHYSKEPSLFEAKSESKMLLTSLRSISSSPVIPRPSSSTEIEEPLAVLLPEAMHSSTFLKTGDVLPVVDITWTYSSYHHKAFETCLRNYYGVRYPPGEVVLNSMQLHLLDSRTTVEPYRSAVGLFDFVKESEPTLIGGVPRKLEIEYLNPLDHFVARQLPLCRPSTEERFTETTNVQHRPSEVDHAAAPSDNTARDPIRNVITGRDKNAGINRRFARKIEPFCKCNLSSARRV
ncbi:hypothetical protein WN55_04951, partial [Dufourea novaeangliae]